MASPIATALIYVWILSLSATSSYGARQDAIILAKFAEKVERYDDMAQAMKTVVEQNPSLSAQERTLFSVAFEKSIDPLKKAWNILTKLEQAGNGGGDETAAGVLSAYTTKIEKQLISRSWEVINLLEDHIMAADLNDARDRVFYTTMVGDYSSLIARITNGEMVTKKAKRAYFDAEQAAETDLSATDLFRLQLAYKLSIFHDEVQGKRKDAIDTAKKAFDKAIQGLESVDEDTYKEVTTLLMLIRSKITEWESDDE